MYKRNRTLLSLLSRLAFLFSFVLSFLLIIFSTSSSASYLPVTGSNIGIGTFMPVGGFVVMNGNVGIGTWSPVGALEVRSGTGSSKFVNISGTFANLAGTRTGLYVDVTAPAVGAGLAAGSWSEVRTTAAAGTYTNAITGSYSESLHSGGATVDDLMGAFTLANQTGSGPVTNAYGLFPNVWKGAGTITNAYGLYYEGVPNINPDTGDNTGVVVNNFGAAFKYLTQGSTRNIGLFLDDVTDGASIAGNFGIYEEAGYENYLAGNVGIGTWAAGGQLSVFSSGTTITEMKTTDSTGANSNESRYYAGEVGQTRATPSTVQNFRFFAGSGAFQEVVSMNVNTPASIGGNVVGAVDFYTQNGAGDLANRMSISAAGVGIGTTKSAGALSVMSGNVGVGTWSPRVGLEVGTAGTLNNVSGNNDVYIQKNLEVDGTIYGDGSGLTNLSALTGGWTDGGPNIYNSTTADNVGIGTTTPYSKVTVSGGQTIGAGFNTTIAPANGLIVQGNVGLGTLEPQDKVQIAGTSGTVLRLTSTNVSTYPEINMYGRPNAGGEILGQMGYYIDSFNLLFARTKAVRDGNNAASFTFELADSASSAVAERMRINGDGNVGIGTSTPIGGLSVMTGNVGIGTWSPNNGLEVKGVNAAVISTGGTNTNATGAGELYVQGDLEVDGTIYGDGSGITSLPAGLAAGGWTDGGTNVYTSTTTDNVGIGTTTPNAATVEIVKNAAQAALKVSSTPTGSGDFLIMTSGGQIGMGTTLMSPVTTMSVMSGNVGIGTWNAKAPLTVRTKDTAGLEVFNTSSGGSAIYITQASASGGHVASFNFRGDDPAITPFNYSRITSGYGSAYASSYMAFLVANASRQEVERMRINYTGSVGIGTTIPVGGTSIMNGNLGIGTWSPSSLLEVKNGPASIITGGGTNSNATGPGELYVQGDLEVDGTIYGDGSGITGVSGITAAGGWTDGGTNVYTSTTTDNVGIGTTTPNTATLEIVKNAAQPLLKLSSAATGAGDFLTINSSGLIGVGTTLNSPPTGLAIMNGSVGIGTWSTPASDMLSIKGGDFTLEDSFPNLKISRNNTIVQTWTFQITSDTGNGFTNGGLKLIPLTGAGDFAVYGFDNVITTISDGDAHNFMVPNGNVGIGTKDPQNGSLIVAAGRVGIGTLTPVGGTAIMNGNVGIGTWSPNNGLEVKGVNAAVISTGGTNTNATAPGELYVQGDLEVDGTIYGDGSGITAGSISNAAGWTDGGTNVYTSTTTDNVGIGTTTPNAATLEVVKNAAQPVFKVSATATGSGDVFVIGSSGNIGIGTTTTSTAGLIIHNGNVGIGTIKSTARLDVSGDTVLQGATDTSNALNVLNAAGTSILRVRGFGDIVVQSSVYMGSANSANFLSAGAFGIASNIAAGNFFITLTHNNGNPALRIRSNSDVLLQEAAGNVGIGTTTPGSKLSVSGNISIGSGSIFKSTAAPADGLMVEGSTGIGTTTPVGGLVVMNGNVGIGTWSSRAGLEIGGGGTINNAGQVDSVYIKNNLEVDGSIYLADGTQINDASDLTGGTGPWTDGGANVYTSTTTDNVGIGTTTPTSTLEIVKTAAATSPLMVSTAATRDGDLLKIDSSGAVGIGTTLASPSTGLAVMNGNFGVGTWAPMTPLQVGSGFVKTTVIDAAGNVGIGTVTTANTALSVLGSVGIGTANNSAYGLELNRSLVYLHNGNNVYLYGNETAGGRVHIGSGATPFNALTVTGASSIGVNTVAPSNGLLVQGNVGIGTDMTSATGKMVVMGSVGLGTATPVGGTAIMNGNVGIGTWSPNNGLEVKGVNAAVISTGGTNTNATGPGELYVQGDLEVDGTIYGDGSGITGGTVANAGGWTDGGTNVYTSTTTDNVGIGTTTPTAKLLIENTSAIDSLRVNDDVLDGSPFVIAADGNVGIGTTAATQKMMIYDANTVYLVLQRSNSTTASGAVQFRGSDGGADWTLATNTVIGSGFEINEGSSSNRLYIAPGGNVGIGTDMTSATAKFSVLGGNVGIGTIFPVSGTAIMNGNVGIGTWSPGAALTVIGGNIAVGTTMSSYHLTIGNALSVGSIALAGTNTTIPIQYSHNLGGNNVEGVLIDASTTNGGGLRVKTGTNSYHNLMGNNYTINWDGPNFAAPFTINRNSSARLSFYDDVTLNNQFSILGNGTETLLFNTFGNIGMGTLAGNLGIGTINPNGGKLIVVGGNVGIGTIFPMNGTAIMNGNVGIGTWSPNAKLEVIGNVSVTDDPYAAGWDGSTNVPTKNAVYDQIQSLVVGGAGGWTDGGTNVYTTTTTDNVGIGTTTPTSTLEVVKTAAGTSPLMISSTATSDGDIFLINSANQIGIGTSLMSPPTALAIMNGNVGIGTWSPRAGLQVSGTNLHQFVINPATAVFQHFYSNETIARSQLTIDAAGSGMDMLQFTTGGLSVASNGIGIGILANRTMGLYTSNGTALLERIRLDGSGNVGIGTTTAVAKLAVVGNIGIGTTASGPFTTTSPPLGGMIIEGNVGIGTTTPVGALTLMNGNVGIGTWSPRAGIEVGGAGTIDNATGVNDVYVKGKVEADGGFFGDGSGLTNINAGGWTDGGTNVYTSATTDNVGIGTTTPNAATLEIVKNAAQPVLKISNSATGNGNYFVVDSAGNVGIGSLDPVAKLFINSAASSAGLHVKGNNSWVGYSDNNNYLGNTTYFRSGSTSSAVISGGTGNSFLAASGGNVGIGTINPTGGLIVMNGNVGIGTWDASGVSGALIVANGATANVGIGTIRPGAKLDVNGVIRSISGGVTFPDGTNQTTAYTGGASAGGWTDGGPNVYTSTTTDNVGIGTTSPNAATLEIVKNAAQPVLKISSTATSAGDFLTINSVGTVAIGTTLSPPTTALAVMSGNLGVGTWAPRTTLDLGSGTLSMRGNNSAGLINAQGTMSIGVDNSIVGTLQLGNSVNGVWIRDTSNNVVAQFGVNNVTSFRNNVGIGTNLAGGGFVVMNGNIGIGTWTTAGESGALIVASGAGNVGIGTIRPGAALDVNGTIRSISGGVTFPDGTNQTTAYTGGASAGGWTDGGTNVYTSTTTDNVGIGTTSPNAATLEIVKNANQSLLKISSIATGNGDYLLIDSSGNLGVGTTAPSSRLELRSPAISGRERILEMMVSDASRDRVSLSNRTNTDNRFLPQFVAAYESSNGLPALSFVGSTNVSNDTGIEPLMQFLARRYPNNDDYLTSSTFSDISSRNLFAFGNSTDQNMMVINSRGNIGLGTTSPQSALAVMSGNVGIGTWNISGVGGALIIASGAGNVGIGTIRPGTALDVNGTVRATAFVGDGSGLTGISGGSVGWTDGGPNVYTSTTTDNVGIGTTTPTSTLEVVKTAAGTASLMVSSSATADGDLFVVNSANQVGIGTTLISPITGLSIMNGNVGIGTWNSQSALTVRGSGTSTANALSVMDQSGALRFAMRDDGVALFGGGTQRSIGGATRAYYFEGTSSFVPTLTLIRNSADAFGPNIYFGKSRSASMGGNAAVSSGDILGGFGFVGANGSDLDNVNVAIVATADGTVNGSSAPGRISFKTTPSGATATVARLDIDNAGNIGFGTISPVGGTAIMNGNVGVGTWSPRSGIEVGGAGTINNAGQVDSVYIKNNLEVDGSIYLADGTQLNDASDLGGASSSGWTDGGTNVYTSATTDNVGIGTTTPTSTLEIVKTAAGTAPLMISSTATGDGDLLIVNSAGAVGIGTTLFTSVTGLSVMNGNVGIGTWNPRARVEMFDDTSNMNLLMTASQGNRSPSLVLRGQPSSDGNIYGQIIFGYNSTGSTDAAIRGIRSNILGFNTNGTERMRIDANGNVGIGTDDPRGKLIVASGNVGIGTLDPIAGLSVMTGNVGIGTWSPVSNVEIRGTNTAPVTVTAKDQQFIQFRESNGSVTRGYVGFTNAGVSGMAFVNAAGSTSPPNMLVSDSGNVGLGTFLQSGALVVMNGNVGIGTWSSPGDSLYIADGNIGIGTYLAYRRIAGPNNGMVMEGNLGVGTWNPSTKVQVVGTVTATAFVGDGSGLTGLPSGGGWTDGGPNVYTSTTTDNIGIGTTTPTGTLEVVKTAAGTAPFMVSTVATADGNLLEIDSSGAVGIGTTLASPVTGLSVMNGNVGIGTWSPASLLYLNSGINASTDILILNAGYTANNIEQRIKIQSIAGGFTYNLGYMGSGFDSSGTAGYLAFGTGNNTGSTERMRIQNGNVGIGTSSGLGGLAVMNGNVGIGTWSAPADTLYIADGNIGIGTYLAYRRISAPNNGMVMEGNLGVGTWNPSTKVQVVGTVTATAFVGDGSGLTNVGGSGWTDGGTNVYTSTTTDTVGIGTTTPRNSILEITSTAVADMLRINDNGVGDASPMIVDGGGNVGIGTSSAAYKLDVVDNNASFSWIRNYNQASNSLAGFYGLANLANSWVELFASGSTLGNTYLGITNGSYLLLGNDISGGAVGTYYNVPFVLGSNNAERMRITNGGNIGIGTDMSGSLSRLAILGGPVGIGTTLASPTTGFSVMTGNVGIGTWSPTAILQIKGLNCSSNANGGALTADSNGNIACSDDDSGAAGTSGWTDGGTNVYTSTTTDNVGIGTTTPSTTLEIVKQGSSPPLMISSVPTGDGDLMTVFSDGSIGIGTTSYNSTSATRVFMKTTNDTSVLELYGPSVSNSGVFNVVGPLTTTLTNGKAFSVLVSNESFARGIFYTDGSYGIGNGAAARDIYMSRPVAGTLLISSDRTGVGLGTFSVIGRVGIGTFFPSGTMELVKSAAGTAPLMVSSTPSGDGNILIVNSAGSVGIGTTLMTPGNGLSVMNGYVGIGTWAPGSPLTIRGGRADTIIELNPWSAGGLNWILASTDNNNAAGGGLFEIQRNQDSTLQPRFAINSAGDLGIGTALTAGGTSIMNGNFGIGTWSPTAILQIKGLNCSSNANGGALTADSNGNIACSDDDSGAAGSSGWTDGGPNVYTSTTTDTVGIGTTTASTTFEIVKQSANAPLMVSGAATSDGDYLFISSAGSTGVGTTLPAPPTRLAVFGGNVGIGTWNAVSSLNIATNDAGALTGSGLISKGNAAIFTTTAQGADVGATLGLGGITDNSGTQRLFGVIAGRKENSTVLDTSGYLSLVTHRNTIGMVERMRISSDGAVGIGTYMVTPSTGLSVMNGNVGIGTWGGLANSLSIADGNIGIGTYLAYRRNSAPNNGMIMEGNLGVGTWNPRYVLDVHTSSTGYVNFQSDSTSDPTPMNLMIMGYASTAGNTASTLQFLTGNSGGNNLAQIRGLQGSGATDAGRLLLDTQRHVTGFVTAIYMNENGNVGIGSYNPGGSGNLEIFNRGSNKPLIISSSSAGAGDLLQVDSRGGVGVGTTKTSPATSLAVMSGNVGIGTWNPRVGLEVGGGGTLNNVSTNRDVYVQRNLEVDGTIYGDGGGITGLVGASGWTDGGAMLYPTTLTDTVGIGTTLTSPVTGLSVMNGNVGIGTWNVDSASLAVITGNVGIGTRNPLARLEVGSDSTADEAIVVRSQGKASLHLLSDTLNGAGEPGGAYVVMQQDGTAVAGMIGVSQAGNTDPAGNSITNTLNNAFMLGTGYNSGSETDGGLVFYTNNGVRRGWLIITRGGNVGIGTNAPVGGTAIMNGNVGIGTWNPSSTLTLFGNVGIGTTLPYRTIAGPNNGAIVEGNIGLGTWNPDATYKMHVLGGSVGGIRVDNNGYAVWSNTGNITAGGGFRIAGHEYSNMSRGSNNLNIQSEDALTLGVNGTAVATSEEALRITTGRNVGIGTSFPVGGLTVMNGNVGVGTWSPNGGLVVMQGNVGIGTSSPVAKLNVMGATVSRPVTLTYGATVNTDAALGNYFTILCTGASGSFTLANPTNAVDGQKIMWRIKQHTSGGQTISLDTKFRLGADITSVTLSTGNSKVDYIGAVYNAVDDKWDVIAFVKGY